MPLIPYDGEVVQESQPALTPYDGEVIQDDGKVIQGDGKGITGHVRDLGLSLAKSVIAVPEAIVGLADIPTGGAVGNTLENQGGIVGFRPKEARDILSEYHTPQYKAQQRQFQEADGVLDKAGVALSNPSLITNTAVESLAPMLAGGLIGKGARLLAGAPRALDGLAAAAPRLSAAAAGAVGEGGIMSGTQAEAIRQQTDDGLLTPGQSGAALATGVLGSMFGYAGGRLAQKLGIGDVDTLLAGGVTPQQIAADLAQAPAKSIPRRVIEGAITEGFLEELPQSVSEQVIQNLALDKDWSEGVDDAIVMGTLAGMAIGGPAALMNQPAPAAKVQPQPTPENPNPAPVQRPNPNAGPLSAAANLLPAPESDGTLYGDAAGNVSGNRPSWVNPENDPGRQSFGPGMDSKATGPLPGFADKTPAPLEGEHINLSEAGLDRSKAGSAPRQGETFDGEVSSGPLGLPAPQRLLADGRPDAGFIETNAAGESRQAKTGNVPPKDYVPQGGRGMDQQAPVGKRFGNELAARNAVAKAAQPDTLEVVSVGPKEFEVRTKAPVLQNRDRSTPASITQMREIAARPDYSRLGFSRDFANGAPVVEPGANVSAQQLGRQDVATTGSGRKIPVQYAVVEAASLMPSHDANGTPDQHYATGMKSKSRAIAGNGRVAGLRQAFAQGTATEYVEQLAGDTSLHGISPATIRSMKEPVLVRIMPREEITQDIGDESNTTGVSALSGAEQAMNDARRINIDDMEFSASGEISETTARQFVQSMPKAEQGGLLDGSRPSRQAYDRAESAIFANAYESESLIRLQAQATDPEVRTVLSGLLMAAPKMARLKGAGAWDIRGLAVEAAEAAVNARRNGQTLEQFAQQIDLERNPESQYFIKLFAANIRSAKRIGEELSATADLFYTEAAKPESDMFGSVPRRSRQELLNGAANADTTRTPASAQAAGNQAGPGAVTPGREEGAAERAEPAGAAADSPAEPAGQEFQLESYDEQQLAEQSRQKAEADAKAAAEAKAAADKAQADRDRNDFTLTGSDRPSDVAASRGQNDMFAPQTRGERKTEQAQRNPVDYLREIVRQSNVTQTDAVGAARGAILNPDASAVERQALLEEVGATDAQSIAELDAALVKWWRRHFRARGEHKAKANADMAAFDQQRRDRDVEDTLELGRQAAADLDAQRTMVGEKKAQQEQAASKAPDTDKPNSTSERKPIRFASDQPASDYLADGSIIEDGQGQQYRVHYQRNDLVLAHPIIDGKAQVSAESGVRFHVGRPESADGRRTDPIYLVQDKRQQAQGVADQLASMNLDDLSALIDEISEQEAAPQTAKPKAQRSSKAKTASGKPRVRSTTSKAERTDTAKPDDVSRSAGEIAKSLGVNMSSAGMNALEGLTKLFGGPGRLNSGLSFDEETYAKAKPFFAAAMRDIEAAGKDLRDFIRALLSQFGDGVKPYILRYAQDIKQEQDSVYSGERVGADSSEDAGQAAGGNAGGSDAGAVGSAAGSLGQGESGQQRPDAAAGVSGRGAAAKGERSDKPVDGTEPAVEGSDAGAADSGRGRPSSTGGLFAGRDTDAAADRAIASAVTPAKANVLPSSKPGTAAEIKAQMPFLTDGQAEDVAFAERRLSLPEGYGVLYTNGTGTGKTFTGLGTAARAHANGKRNILIVAPKQTIVDAWVKAGEKFFGLPIKVLESTKDNGGSGIVATTYANLGANPSLAQREWDLVIADEAHYLSSAEDGATTSALENLRALTKRRGYARDLVRLREAEKVARVAELNKTIPQRDKEISDGGGNANFDLRELARDKRELDALNAELNALYEKEEAAFNALKPEDKPRGVFLSATPFAYEKNVQWAQEFLFDWGSDDGSSQAYNAGGPFERFMIQHFGYRMRYNKLTEPDAKVDRGLMQRAFNTWLKSEGALSGRALDSAYDYDRLFVTLESPIGQRVDEALKWLWNHSAGRDVAGNELDISDELKAAYRDLNEKITKENFNYHARMYFLEAIKAREALPHIRAQLALGRKVVVMHDFKQGGAVNPFILSTPADDPHMKEAIQAFSYEFSDLQRAFSYLPSPITQLTKAFPDALVYNGNFSAKQRLAMQNAFNDDSEDAPKLIIAQGDAMREGVSIHDTSGKHPRVLVHLGMPVKPTASIQQEGRIYRTGQASHAMFRYFTIGTAWERSAFADKIAKRAGAAENLAMGELARGLKQAFIDAYENADLYEPGFDGEGKGGKESDAAAAALLTPWDSAKSFYFGTKTQGKGRSSRGREGADYFATPEPVGLKMVEWADIRAGESVLEPSAGHGAIARWFPDGAKVRVIEQSGELASRVALHVDGDVVHGSFEDHHIVNKYDAIVMNPPFGLGGAEAIPHLAKAADHLREGGRVVALIPTGPAADKRFDNWFYALDKNGKSQRPELHLIADIKLPGVTFERAGTNTPTRIVIIEKVSGEQAEQLQPARQRDLSSATDIGELFDRLERMEMPARLKPVEQEAEQTAPAKSVENKPVKVGEVDTWGAKHTKTGAELFMAKPAARLSNEEYKRISSLAKQHNGYWSKFGKPGFLFASEQDRTAFVEAVKGSSTAEVNEEGARYTAGTGSAPQMLREPTTSEDGYETDLFGNPVSAAARKNRPARSGRAAVQRDVQPAAGVPADTPTPAGEYSVRTIIGSEVSRRLGTDRINSAADLAQATQYLHRSAVERFDGIVTDRHGKPLAVVGGFKGAIDSASVYPATILGEAVRVPGAANIWFSHNHPSGNSELSSADRHLFTRLADVFEGSGIEPGGLIAVGRGEFSATDGSKGAIPAGGRIVSVPAIEREQVGEPLQQTVTSPTEAMEIAAASYAAAKAPGILLLNSRHAVTGWTPIAKAMIDGPLRHTGQLNAIYRAISEGNPGAAILVHGGELDAVLVGAHDAANNIAAAIAKTEVRVLDVINVKTKRSRAEKGEQIVGNILYRLNPGKTKGLPLFSAKGIAKKLQGSMGLRVEAVADESQLPEAVRAQIQRDGVSGRVAGVYHNGTSYLIASNLHDTKHAISTVLHEAVGHGGVKAVLGEQIGQVMRSIYRDMPAAMRSELERRYAGQLAGMTREAGQELVAEEYVAHLAEHDPRNGLLNRVVALIKQFIRQVFGADAAGKWTRADVVQLLAEAKKAAAGRGPNGGGSRYRSGAAADDGPAMPEVGEASEAEFVASLQGTGAERAFASAIYKARGTQSPFFQRWFGNSRMVNKEGRPMTFVHRSFGERDTFDDAGLGGNTGTATAALGHYLARTDVGNVERYGPVTERFYIRMEKPKVITQDQFEAMGDWSLPQVKAYRKTLMDQGYDGLYITGLAWPVVFEGKNIKAVRNVGTFDDSSSTRYAAQLQTETPAFRRWFGDSKAVDANGKPLVVYHGTVNDFDTFGGKRSAEGFHFGSAGQANFRLHQEHGLIFVGESWSKGGHNIVPVYLSIRNPKRLKDRSGSWKSAVQKAKDEGYDGIVYLNRGELPKVPGQPANTLTQREWKALSDDEFKARFPQAEDSWIAFNPEQIKSAIGNNGDFDPANADIRYSLNSDAATREALRKMGLGGESDAGLIEKIRNLTWGSLKAKISSMATRAEEGLFDGLVGIKRAEEAVGVNDPNRQGYVSARLATGLADVMHAVLHYGAPEWRDGIIQRRDGTKGVLEILAGLGQDNLQAWLGWLGGKRGQMLKAEGRENNLSDTDIAELLAMGRGKEELFERVYREYAAVNEAVLDLAEGAGLIDPTAREKWATEYYVPFYRQSESEGIFTGPRTKRGLSHQTAAIKKLKGGELPTNDLLVNILSGWTKRIDASMKNKALLETVDNLKGTDYLADEGMRWTRLVVPRAEVAKKIKGDRVWLEFWAEQLGMDETANHLQVAHELNKLDDKGYEELWGRVAPTDPDIIRVQRGGKNEFYRVKDDSLLRGLKFIEGSTFNDPITRIGRTFKRMLTTGVTASPDFILRNFIRDAAHAWTINKDGFTFGVDSIKGMRKAFAEDEAYRDLMFGGASFQGGYIHGTDPEASADIIRRALAKKGLNRSQQDSYLGSLVDTPAKAGAMLRTAWEKYRELGDKVENANRLSTYTAAREAGKSKRQAAFEAKDLMDFSMRGNFAAAQWFTDVVPFLNARAQGLYKLGRAMKGDKTLIAKEVAMKGGYLALFSLLLAAANGDDERYKALPNWDKDLYWHIWLSDDQVQPFRIPKPFELGLLFGTVPERMLHAATGTQDGSDLGRAVAHGVLDTLAFNPLPQVVKPLIEVVANRDFFRDTDIEGMADEGKVAEARYDERTSDIGYGIGQVTGRLFNLSPKQVDHLIKGYTGTLGAYVLGVADLIANAVSEGEGPDWHAGDIPLVRTVYQGDSVRPTQYQTEFYDALREADQLYRTVRAYREEGRLDEARELQADSRDKLRHRPALGFARRQLGVIRNQMESVRRDKDLSGEVKQQRLDNLQRRANAIAERIAKRVEGDF